MNNRFNLNEEEKNRIRTLHNINVISEQGFIWNPEVEEHHKQQQRVGESMEDYEKRARKEGFNPCDGRAPQFVTWLKEQGRDCKEIQEMIKNGTWKGSEAPVIVGDSIISIEKEADIEGLNEDAGMDTPGGNPDYFYSDDSIIGKLRKDPDYIKKLNAQAKSQDSEMSKEDVINELIGIYSYSQDGATDLVNTALETLISNLGGFKDN
jgi:hypothetical protein